MRQSVTWDDPVTDTAALDLFKKLKEFKNGDLLYFYDSEPDRIEKDIQNLQNLNIESRFVKVLAEMCQQEVWFEEPLRNVDAIKRCYSLLPTMLSGQR